MENFEDATILKCLFLAALAALYLTLVSESVTHSLTECYFWILTQRVTFDTWDPSDIGGNDNNNEDNDNEDKDNKDNNNKDNNNKDNDNENNDNEENDIKDNDNEDNNKVDNHNEDNHNEARIRLYCDTSSSDGTPK